MTAGQCARLIVDAMARHQRAFVMSSRAKVVLYGALADIKKQFSPNAIEISPPLDLAAWPDVARTETRDGKPMMMMLRLPYGDIPMIDVVGSIAVLALTVPLVVWGGAKVFRASLLMYGKRPALRQIVRVLREA